jgi:hypothetical protein
MLWKRLQERAYRCRTMGRSEPCRSDASRKCKSTQRPRGVVEASGMSERVPREVQTKRSHIASPANRHLMKLASRTAIPVGAGA